MHLSFGDVDTSGSSHEFKSVRATTPAMTFCALLLYCKVCKTGSRNRQFSSNLLAQCNKGGGS